VSDKNKNKERLTGVEWD